MKKLIFLVFGLFAFLESGLLAQNNCCKSQSSCKPTLCCDKDQSCCTKAGTPTNSQASLNKEKPNRSQDLKARSVSPQLVALATIEPRAIYRKRELTEE